MKLIISMGLVASLIFITVPNVVTPVASQNPTIKIGSLGPLAIPVGVDMDNGAKLAVKEINDGGGLTVKSTKYDFELITETTSGSDGLPDASVAATNLQDLITTKGVVAVLGGFRTEVVLGAVQPTINSTKTPFLGVGSTAPIITEYYYRVGPPNGTTLARNVISLYATHLKPNNNVSNVVVVREDAAWTSAISAAIKGALEGLFDMSVDTETIDPIPESASGSDVAASLNPLVNDNSTDAILTLFSAPVGKAVTEQWAALGLNQKMYLAGINVAGQDSEYFTNTDGAASGEIVVENAPPDANPTSKSADFRAAYEAAYGEQPTYTAFAAYDAVYILKDAIERADDFTSAAIHGALPDTDYLGVAARYKFTSESTAGQVASPAVPETFKKYNNSIAHDLFTPSTIGVPGFPYSQLYFAQWLSDGSKTAIWGGTSEGYSTTVAPPYTVDTADETDTSSEVDTPGFEWYFVVFATFTFLTVRKLKKLRK